MHWRKAKKIRTAILNGNPEDVKGNCYFCGKEVDGNFFCFGCKEFVCAGCDLRNESGPHSVEAHRMPFRGS